MANVMHYLTLIPTYMGSIILLFVIIWVAVRDAVILYQELFRAVATFFLLIAAVLIGTEKAFPPLGIVCLTIGLVFQALVGLFPAFMRTFFPFSRPRPKPFC